MAEDNTPESKSPWTIDRVIPIGISFLALLLSGYVAYLQNDTARRSNRPYMHPSFYIHPQYGVAYRVINHGVGAAYLHWFQILLDDKPLPHWGEVHKILGIKSEQYEHLRPPAVWQPSSVVEIYRAPPGEITELLQKNVSRINFRYCYCSIFDECWIGTARYAPKALKKCPQQPEIIYGGFPKPPEDWQYQ